MESGPYTLEIAKRWIRGVMELRDGLDMLQKAIMDLRVILYFFFRFLLLNIYSNRWKFDGQTYVVGKQISEPSNYAYRLKNKNKHKPYKAELGFTSHP